MPELSRRKRLEKVRDHLTGLLAVEADGAKAASLSRELRAVLSDLEKLGVGRSSSRVDDLAAKRAKRLAASKGSDEAAAQE